MNDNSFYITNTCFIMHVKCVIIDINELCSVVYTTMILFNLNKLWYIIVVF
jgi:hypothetical protein